MRAYLDVCCLNRPFDDQSQERVRLEAEAVTLFLRLVSINQHEWITSEAVEDELKRMPSEEQRICVSALLRHATGCLQISQANWELARHYIAQGLGAMDALHLAVAETAHCDILLTTDDSFLRKAAGLQPRPRVRVANPAKWIAEVLEP
jgi:predicted nucleic acid-binding protein